MLGWRSLAIHFEKIVMFLLVYWFTVELMHNLDGVSSIMVNVSHLSFFNSLLLGWHIFWCSCIGSWRSQLIQNPHKVKLNYSQCIDDTLLCRVNVSLLFLFNNFRMTKFKAQFCENNDVLLMYWFTVELIQNPNVVSSIMVNVLMTCHYIF